VAGLGPEPLGAGAGRGGGKVVEGRAAAVDVVRVVQALAAAEGQAGQIGRRGRAGHRGVVGGDRERGRNKRADGARKPVGATIATLAASSAPRGRFGGCLCDSRSQYSILDSRAM
jgi:hypothetical protein